MQVRCFLNKIYISDQILKKDSKSQYISLIRAEGSLDVLRDVYRQTEAKDLQLHCADGVVQSYQVSFFQHYYNKTFQDFAAFFVLIGEFFVTSRNINYGDNYYSTNNTPTYIIDILTSGKKNFIVVFLSNPTLQLTLSGAQIFETFSVSLLKPDFDR